ALGWSGAAIGAPPELVNRPLLTSETRQGVYVIEMPLSSVYFSSACSERSRPKPDCFMPPNGTVMSQASQPLIHTSPVFNFRATRCARETFAVHRPEARPYTVSLATRTASSSS